MSGLPFPSPGDFPNPGIELMPPALAEFFFTTEPPGKPREASLGKYRLKNVSCLKHCGLHSGGQCSLKANWILPPGEYQGVGGWGHRGGKFGIQRVRPSFLRARCRSG